MSVMSIANIIRESVLCLSLVSGNLFCVCHWYQGICSVSCHWYQGICSMSVTGIRESILCLVTDIRESVLCLSLISGNLFYVCH